MTNCYLIIIDMLIDFLGRWGREQVARLIKNTNAFVHAFRMSRLPVIWVRQEFKPDLSDAFLEMFVAGDQLLKGAALNAVQIAERLLDDVRGKP